MLLHAHEGTRRAAIPMLVGLLILPTRFQAQQLPKVNLHISGQAIPVWTTVDRIPGGRRLDEIRVVQPMFMVHAQAWNRVNLRASLDVEGKTIPDGELTPGAFGEGYVDRRHPHTYVHEVMLSVNDVLHRWDGTANLTLSLGKGFVPFGTDDPMSRPTLRYPVNHHYSQILERAVGIVGMSAGPVLLEGAIFNGDEPERPSQWPVLDRFGDSWSLRLTLMPINGIELQGSIADVHSPEHRGGVGLDQSKLSLSLRWDGPIARVPAYVLAEWAESSEGDRFFVFNTYLAEAQVSPGRFRGYFRFERTKRPEEMRTANPFREVRPHLDNSLLGITRWDVQTAGLGVQLGPLFGGFRVEPFGEVSYATVTGLAGVLFRPQVFYGGTDFWAVSGGLRLSWNLPAGHRMGRYSAGSAPAMTMPMMHH